MVSWKGKAMIIRGVTTRRVSKTEQVEEVCTCQCHDPGVRMMHFMACCNPPRTDAGKAALEAYNDELLLKKLEDEKE